MRSYEVSYASPAASLLMWPAAHDFLVVTVITSSSHRGSTTKPLSTVPHQSSPDPPPLLALFFELCLSFNLLRPAASAFCNLSTLSDCPAAVSLGTFALPISIINSCNLLKQALALSACFLESSAWITSASDLGAWYREDRTGWRRVGGKRGRREEVGMRSVAFEETLWLKGALASLMYISLLIDYNI
jgi:hypothetical protein